MIGIEIDGNEMFILATRNSAIECALKPMDLRYVRPNLGVAQGVNNTPYHFLVKVKIAKVSCVTINFPFLTARTT